MFFRLVRDFSKDPLCLYLRARHRLDPLFLWHRYASLCKKAGLKESIFILSFDCDTDEDISVVWGVHSRLQEIGITPVYAVPGELLRRGNSVYGKIYESGAEFINHGERQHTIFKHNQYISTLFYDQLTAKEVQQDVLTGHETLKDVLGITAKGFRTPHFGSFNTRSNLIFLYNLLVEMRYSFSSSALPISGIKDGPAVSYNGLVEIPLTGFFTHPNLLLDSWGIRFSDNRLFTQEIYMKEIKKYVEFAEDSPILINLYADPSQVYDWDEFFDAMKILTRFRCQSFSGFLNDIRGK